MEARATAAVFDPVASHSTYEETVARLGTAIRIGVLSPGTRLPPERELAEQLGISRSTLRQALGTLTETGHLVALRGRAGGTFVAETPPIASGDAGVLDEWRRLLDWRIAIEVGVTQVAVERMDDADAARLESARLAAEEAGRESWHAYRRADASFHLVLAEATGSARLIATMTELQGELTDLLDRIAHPSQALGHSNEQHRRIVAALRARDAAGAAAAMRAHLDATERIVEGLLP